MPASVDVSERRVTDHIDTAVIFNAVIGGAAIAAAFELGLLDAIQSHGCVSLDDFCERHDLHRPSLEAVTYALACFQIVELREGRDMVVEGPLFRQAHREQGYFLWLVRGYGHLWQHMAELCANGNRPSDPDVREFVGRDGRSIAMAGREYGAKFVDTSFERALGDDVGTVAADLGCGSAARLIALARSQPAFRGIGIDINPDTVALARESVRAAGLSGRIAIVHGDVRDLARQPGFEKVEILFCFFMGHDLWPRSRCRAVLRNLLDAFPSARRFLLCDTFRADAAPSPGLPTFQLGFECTHLMMGQVVPSASEWRSLFEESGWRCASTHPVEIPESAIFDLRPGAVS